MRWPLTESKKVYEEDHESSQAAMIRYESRLDAYHLFQGKFSLTTMRGKGLMITVMACLRENLLKALVKAFYWLIYWK